MFSFPRPGCVQTGTPGYAYVFDAMSGESYIFLRDLAVGSQSKVQLVANIFTKEVVVRKVSKQTPPLNGASTLTNTPEDREVYIIDHLNSILHNPVHSFPAFTPRWTTCLSHETMPVMSNGPRPRMEYMHVSYWKFCNAGSLSEWMRSWRTSPGTGSFPVSLIARCIAQVSQTLHIMYQAGPEPVYHCDLHLGNIFIHFDDPSHPGSLPDFYLGDFGWSRTATEARADSLALYGNGTPILSSLSIPASSFTTFTTHSNTTLRTSASPPPDTAPPHQRRKWDITRFLQGLDSLVELAISPANHNPPQSSEPAAGLKQLIAMLRFVDAQEQRLAALNPHSRLASLVEVVREAKNLEVASLAVERGREEFRGFVEGRRGVATEMVTGARPYVFTGGHMQGLSREVGRMRAERFGRENIGGFNGVGVVESV
jgi:serine/threonine protein kinase